MKRLVETRQIVPSYRKGVKKHVLKGLPAFEFAVKVKDKSTQPPSMHYQRGLKALPDRLLTLGPLDDEVLLRQEGFTTLKDLKDFHWRVCESQGLTREAFLQDCWHLSLSVDGVKESQHAKKTLKLMSVRFGTRAIYVYKVFNYLLKNNDAKPTPNEILE